jgi:uncharacterized phage protein (TIGR02218 family)
MTAAFDAHMATGLTTVCRCWRVVRADGVTLGFTDHDLDLAFEGVVHRAGSGLTAKALAQGTGLSVNNSEALGALTDAAIREADVEAGRYDHAEVKSWLVNWRDPAERRLTFRGHIGDIRRGGGAFHAELRGLSDLLNQPQGRIYQPGCAAVLGDASCGVNLSLAGHAIEAQAAEVTEARSFLFDSLPAHPDRWFERGLLTVRSGPGDGLSGVIKTDRLLEGGARRVELWEPIRAQVAVSDLIRLVPGCDKSSETCRVKFDNLLNFRGFPSIPGEDWLMAIPRRDGEA